MSRYTRQFYDNMKRCGLLDYERNLRYRLRVRKRAAVDPVFRAACWEACSRDVLYWLATWAVVYEPRPRFDQFGILLPKKVPMLPWEHQEPLIYETREALGTRDIGIEKSRGEGMSWIGIFLAVHDWLFDPLAKVGIVSNTEKKADDPGNLDSLLAKADFLIANLPEWMGGLKNRDYTRNVSDHSLVNLRNGSQINAFAATGDAGRAGRYKWFMADELAWWEEAKASAFINGIRSSTDSRLVISTPNGNSGTYYDFMHAPSNILRLKLHWSQNRTKNRGLYQFVNNVPVAVDPINNPLPPDYNPPSQDVQLMFTELQVKGFKLKGKLRSPWYDNECYRADATPFKIAQELDLDYGGTMYRIFGSDFFDKAEGSVRPPRLRGVLHYNPETLEPEFEPNPDGEVLLWMDLDAGRNPPPQAYVVGADVATGLGGSYTSNSALVAINAVTREQVVEIASNTVEPADWADLAIALSKWLNEAYLAWEHNGPGTGFTKKVMERGYSNVYYRDVLWKRKKTKEMGWWTDDKSKEVMFMTIGSLVRAGDVVLKSDMIVKECGQYVRQGAKIEHVQAKNTDDDSSKGVAHGDRVIALGTAVMALKDRPMLRNVNNPLTDPNRPPPPNTLAARELEWQAAQRKKNDDWNDKTNLDLAWGPLVG